MERRSIRVRGVVQGVGFRPFVFGLAERLGLTGSVRNQTSGVWIEAEGAPADLERLLDAIATSPPPLARIDGLTWERIAPQGDRAFTIAASEPDAPGDIVISPDVAPCDACLRELADPADRRYAYPFLNCTHCGPRLTIVEGAPYDRARTTMARFPMCPECRREYEDPRDRRFHAQPTACPTCGPRLEWRAGPGPETRAAGPEALDAAVHAIAAGAIVAVKGLGGYHLACDARRPDVVAELRRRKGREERPLALMVADLDAARALCEVDDAQAELLLAKERPIALLPRRAGAEALEGVAPGMPMLGLLLPYTPLHALLMARLAGPIVLTSGNASDEPICYREEDARATLEPLADGILTHDRAIAFRCDDSVVRFTGAFPIWIRRSRGLAPRPIAFSPPAPAPILALGGHQKNTFCAVIGARAILSQHIGDLDTAEARRGLEDAVTHYERLFEVAPAAIACDLHPNYASSFLARALSEARGLPLLRVQHHHAHAAAALAEHGATGPAIGIVLDGTGLGTDGTIWGFEFLLVDGAAMHRLGSLEPMPLPGGDAAARDLRRSGFAYLRAAYGADVPATPVLETMDDSYRRGLKRMLDGGVNVPLASSAGRLFDAVAAILGLRGRATFEGQAAAELEGAAVEGGGLGVPYSIELIEAGERFAVSFRSAIRELVEGRRRGEPLARAAARFHATVVEAVRLGARRAREMSGVHRAVLSGGTFQNALVLDGAVAALTRDGFEVLTHRDVPPNDGGLALGQAAVAAAILRGERAAEPEAQAAPV